MISILSSAKIRPVLFRDKANNNNNKLPSAILRETPCEKPGKKNAYVGHTGDMYKSQ